MPHDHRRALSLADLLDQIRYILFGLGSEQLKDPIGIGGVPVRVALWCLVGIDAWNVFLETPVTTWPFAVALLIKVEEGQKS